MTIRHTNAPATARMGSGGTGGPLACLLLGVVLAVAGIDPGPADAEHAPRTQDAVVQDQNEVPPAPESRPTPPNTLPIDVDAIVRDLSFPHRGGFVLHRSALPLEHVPGSTMEPTAVDAEFVRIEVGEHELLEQEAAALIELIEKAWGAPAARVTTATSATNDDRCRLSETLEGLRIDIDLFGRRGEESDSSSAL